MKTRQDESMDRGSLDPEGGSESIARDGEDSSDEEIILGDDGQQLSKWLCASHAMREYGGEHSGLPDNQQAGYYRQTLLSLNG